MNDHLVPHSRVVCTCLRASHSRCLHVQGCIEKTIRENTTTRQFLIILLLVSLTAAFSVQAQTAVASFTSTDATLLVLPSTLSVALQQEFGSTYIVSTSSIHVEWWQSKSTWNLVAAATSQGQNFWLSVELEPSADKLYVGENKSTCTIQACNSYPCTPELCNEWCDPPQSPPNPEQDQCHATSQNLTVAGHIGNFY